mgnify:CR=1 FL=1
MKNKSRAPLIIILCRSCLIVKGGNFKKLKFGFQIPVHHKIVLFFSSRYSYEWKAFNEICWRINFNETIVMIFLVYASEMEISKRREKCKFISCVKILFVAACMSISSEEKLIQKAEIPFFVCTYRGLSQ